MEQYSENDPLLGRSGDNFSVNRKQSNERQYITYPKRWFMLAVFSLLAFSNGVVCAFFPLEFMIHVWHRQPKVLFIV